MEVSIDDNFIHTEMQELISKLVITQDEKLVEKLFISTSKYPLFRGVMTKRLFYKLPSGAYYLGDLRMPGVWPLSYGQVPPTNERGLFWSRWMEFELDKDIITLFNNRDAYDTYIEHMSEYYWYM